MLTERALLQDHSLAHEVNGQAAWTDVAPIPSAVNDGATRAFAVDRAEVTETSRCMHDLPPHLLATVLLSTIDRPASFPGCC